MYSATATLLASGIRKYTNASRLLMHVDTMDTHAVSGIINVDQDVHSPWMLEVRENDIF
jgi:hypothetical protein